MDIASDFRYLHVITSVAPAIGGPAHTLRARARLASLDDERMGLASWDQEGSEALQIPGCRTHSLGPGHGRYSWSHAACRRLATIASGYDILVLHGLWQWSGPVVRRVARRLDMPYVQFCHGMFDPWFAKAYPLKGWKKRLYWWLLQYAVVRDAARTCFTSGEELRLARTAFRPMHLHPELVAYGSDAPDAATVLRESDRREPGRVLHLGRIDRKKGCDVLLDAFARIAPDRPDARLALTGPDPEALGRDLERRAGSLGIADRIEWTGMVQGADKWRQFHRADVFALASHSENFGVAVVEALACRVPVVITRRVNIWPTIQRWEAGICVEDTVEGMTAGLRRWLSLPHEAQEAMRDRARACYEANFSPEAAKASLDRVLIRALDDHRARRRMR